MLFGGSQQHHMGTHQLKLSIGLNNVSFKMLSYTCYLHEGIALLRRLSRSAFIMTQNRELLDMFARKMYEVPIYSNHSLFYAAPQVEKCIKLVNGKNMKRLSDTFYDLQGLRTVSYLENLSRCENITKLMHPLISGPCIEDLDDSHEVITLLEKDMVKNFQF